MQPFQVGMTGQFYLSLLNPVIAMCCAGLVAWLGRKWPGQAHFFPLSLAFLYLGIGFITQEVPWLSRVGQVNYAGNALFMGAMVLACIAALERTRRGVPVLAFGVICTLAAVLFFWFALVEPSTTARIVALNGAMALLALVTLARLLSAPSKTSADRLFVIAVALGVVLAIARPAMVLAGLLDAGDQRGMGAEYWETVVAITPVVSVGVAGVFVCALVLDIVSELKWRADFDFLTGLLNRRGFELAVSPDLENSEHGQALLVADIDDFKRINDQFGHAVGDGVIAAVGKALAVHGGADNAGRMGGEEFALFYRQSARHLLEECAVAVRASLSQMGIVGLPAGYRLTISIGLHLREPGEALAQMMLRADRALYDAKAQGKDRAVLARARLISV